MRITLTCVCGSEATFDDDKNIYTVPWKARNNEERVYVVKAYADHWMATHRCPSPADPAP